MFKRIIGMTLAAAMTVGVFASCSSETLRISSNISVTSSATEEYAA